MSRQQILRWTRGNVRDKFLVFFCLSWITQAYLSARKGATGSIETLQLTLVVQYLAKRMEEIQVLLFPRQRVEPMYQLFTPAALSYAELGDIHS